VIINCAAHVGGIEYGRKNPIALYRDNLLMNLNILSAASESNSKLINPISNCAYPRDLDIFSEDRFWDGELDESVLVYGGIRKLGWIGARAYSQELGLNSANLIFPNLFGPNDHLDPVRAHALGALVFRFLEAKKLGTPNVVVWGSGSPIREWLYVEDAVDAMLLAVENDINCAPLNIGSGIGISIRELAEKIASAIGYEGSIVYDKSKQDGAPKKIMDARKAVAELGWKPKTSFESGLSETIKSYQARM
jgi:GDP-L-fucose synthase